MKDTITSDANFGLTEGTTAYEFCFVLSFYKIRNEVETLTNCEGCIGL